VEVNNDNVGMIKLRMEWCSFVVIWFWIWLYSLCNVDICYTVLIQDSCKVQNARQRRQDLFAYSYHWRSSRRWATPTWAKIL